MSCCHVRFVLDRFRGGTWWCLETFSGTLGTNEVCFRRSNTWANVSILLRFLSVPQEAELQAEAKAALEWMQET